METWCHRVPPKETHNVASLHLRILKFYHALMQLKQLLGGRPPPKINGWNLRIPGAPWNQEIPSSKPSFLGSMFIFGGSSWWQ